jgi:hypothetical protein
MVGGANVAAPASGGLYITGSALVNGTGVTFYLYNGASINISGYGITLKAPVASSPTFPGILIYQDRSDNSAGTFGTFNNPLAILDLEGAVYMPAANLTFPILLSGTFSNYGIYVANTMHFNGVLGLFVDYAQASGQGGVSPIKGVSLVQ